MSLSSDGGIILARQVEEKVKNLSKYGIAAKVTVSARRVLVELPYYCPFSSEINLIMERLASEFEIIFS